ncbi:NAD-dependent epimerase/dehydratase family protein [Methanococcus sp. CF]
MKSNDNFDLTNEKVVLITGAGGFLGSELIAQLSTKTNYKLMALTSEKEKLLNRFPYLDLKIYENNEFEFGQIPWNNVDVIIHCAFARGYKSNQEIASSLKFTNCLFNNASVNGVSGIINISSQGVYGQEFPPLWKEDVMVSPDSIYAFAKYSSELLLENIALTGGNKTRCTNIRLSSLTGGNVGLKPELISKFVNNVLNSELIRIVGGKQVVSYLDVRDAADAIISLLSTDWSIWKQVYNLGSNQQYNIVEIGELVAEIGKKYTGKYTPINVDKKDVFLNVGMDSGLFYNDTGWMPKYDLESTINSLFEYLMRESI